ncbi:GNAT family N-acetyltransferase [Corynebacterium lubricantis]|uniref:GNAT family N-acetyltransferase n=1 Tax=Corynebacterium lubricantis TaxID=541095 RepID=UPI00035EC82C|nr:GNAT family N-acetyltransferase [Corynebacterium lubricantis]
MSRHRNPETEPAGQAELLDGFVVDTDRDRLDLKKVHHWLSTDAYWAKNRPFETVSEAADSSLNFGVYSSTGEQVGYARVVTDGVTFGWLCDVYIAPVHRGKGLGKALSQAVVDTLEPMDLKRIMLLTDDAHELYSSVGFTSYPNLDHVMVLDLGGS